MEWNGMENESNKKPFEAKLFQGMCNGNAIRIEVCAYLIELAMHANCDSLKLGHTKWVESRQNYF